MCESLLAIATDRASSRRSVAARRGPAHARRDLRALAGPARADGRAADRHQIRNRRLDAVLRICIAGCHCVTTRFFGNFGTGFDPLGSGTDVRAPECGQAGTTRRGGSARSARTQHRRSAQLRAQLLPARGRVRPDRGGRQTDRRGGGRSTPSWPPTGRRAARWCGSGLAPRTTLLPSRDVIDVVTDDMPFLVDTITMTLAGHDVAPELVVHPQLMVAPGRVRRAARGAQADRGAAPDRQASRCSWHIERA